MELYRAGRSPVNLKPPLSPKRPYRNPVAAEVARAAFPCFLVLDKADGLDLAGSSAEKYRLSSRVNWVIVSCSGKSRNKSCGTSTNAKTEEKKKQQ